MIKDNEITDIYTFFNDYKNIKKIIYIPNPGNIGDHFIAYVTMQIFNDIGLNYIIGDINHKYLNETIFYGGGGNLIGIYNDCKNFILNNLNNNKIVILPHTVKDECTLIKHIFNDNIKIICREKTSYNYVRKLIKNKSNLYLSKDLSLYIKDDFILKYNTKTKEENICNAFRLDKEKTNIRIPQDNLDLSTKLSKYKNKKDFKYYENETERLFSYLSGYDIINTNRLHIAIASCLLNKVVNLYENNYYKNKAIYNYSLSNNFNNINLFH